MANTHPSCNHSVGAALCPSDIFGAGSSLRIGLVGTYPPRACGLATFTADVATSLRTAGHQVAVAALVDRDDPAGGDTVHRLVRTSAASAANVAKAFSSDVDVVLIQHEFGIFGGVDGALLGELTDRLTVPYVLTLHTVLGRYTDSQRAALAAPLREASLVLVFSDEAANLVANQFPEVKARCRVVPHGAPAELYRPRETHLRGQLGIPLDATVVSTFGLLSPGKGIEQAIRAMASLRHIVDEPLLVVAGRTHPDVQRREGERYREQLVELARHLEVDDVVMFRNWFHGVDELSSLLISSDVFVTPYTGAEQIVSGALSFAIAAGLPFVSTPYRYAVEMAATGCGLTVPFDDHHSLAGALKEIITDDDRRRGMADRARTVASSMSWPQVGHLIADLLRGVAPQVRHSTPLRTATHLRKFHDDASMLSHSHGPVPAIAHG